MTLKYTVGALFVALALGLGAVTVAVADPGGPPAPSDDSGKGP